MNTHPYVRAYMAGIAVPSLFMLGVFSLFCVERFAYNVDVPVERIIVFPLVLVPNLWGVWNILYQALRHRRRLPLGMHGAALPLLLLPAGAILTMRLNLGLPNFFPKVFAVALPCLLIIYYLVWKYLVRFLNDLVGLD